MSNSARQLALSLIAQTAKNRHQFRAGNEAPLLDLVDILNPLFWRGASPVGLPRSCQRLADPCTDTQGGGDIRQRSSEPATTSVDPAEPRVQSSCTSLGRT